MLLSEPGSWLSSPGPRSDVILSTRVRVARNLDGSAFPPRANRAELEDVRERALGAMAKSNYLTNALVIRMEDADPATRRILVERHLVSPEFVESGPGRAAVIGENEVVSAMVNEEDHLRLQCIRPGLQPVDAWRLTDRLDRELEQNLQYAFSIDWGYLTSCPTNVGTGIRVSVLAHLMGLARSSRIAEVLGSVSKLGLSVRGFYGEGSAALGGFFQISNQTTLGQTEEDIAYTVERVAAQLAGLELDARSRLVEKAGRRIADEGWRAYGLLTNARMISAEEVMELVSSLRLGVALGVIDRVDLGTVNRLLVVTQPGHLMYAHGGEATADQEDGARADLVRKELASCDQGAGSP